MIQAEIMVNEVLDPQDAHYSIHEDLMWYAWGIVAEYENRSYHGGVKVWWMWDLVLKRLLIECKRCC